MKFVGQFQIKIKNDAFASLDGFFLINNFCTTCPNSQFMMSTKEYAESNAEATKSIISIAEIAIVLKDLYCSKCLLKMSRRGVL
jgi:hypothetical protein